MARKKVNKIFPTIKDKDGYVKQTQLPSGDVMIMCKETNLAMVLPPDSTTKEFEEAWKKIEKREEGKQYKKLVV